MDKTETNVLGIQMLLGKKCVEMICDLDGVSALSSCVDFTIGDKNYILKIEKEN